MYTHPNEINFAFLDCDFLRMQVEPELFELYALKYELKYVQKAPKCTILCI